MEKQLVYMNISAFLNWLHSLQVPEYNRQLDKWWEKCMVSDMGF